ncbi:MAG: YfhO family protein [bacterium]|nr:YfhO family protein [bacterium]
MDTPDTKKKIPINKILLYLCSAFLPMLLMLVVYMLLGQWPFGSKGLYAFPDSYSQYTNYYEYYRSLPQNGILYSFSRTLGGDLVGFFTYYTLSPYNLLFLLLPQVAAGKLMTVITLLKIGSCGLTFSILLNHERKAVYSTLLFSTSYAMMSYLIIYSQNMNFMDVVILLPLVILGLRRLIRSRRAGLYIASLAASLTINYYFGYMLCIFSVLYFLYEMLLQKALRKKDILSRVKLFLLSSLAAGGLSAVTLIPALYSLSGGRGPGDLKGLLHFTSQFRTLDFVSRLNIGAYTWSDVSSTLPNIYAGIVMLALCMLFFSAKKITVKEKIVSGAFLLIMFFSCKLYFFNTVWHCMNEPHGSPVRYSFVISCLMILFAYRAYEAEFASADSLISKLSCSDGTITTDKTSDNHTPENEPIESANSCLRIQVTFFQLFRMFLYGALFVIVAFLVYRQDYLYISKPKLLLTIAVFAVCLGILLIQKILLQWHVLPRFAKCLPGLLGILCCLELTANAYFTYEVFPFRDMDYQNEYTAEYAPAISYVKEYDAGLYRMEKTTSVTTNDPMLYHYNGISHDSSFHKFALQDFCDNLGLTSHGSIIHYDRNASLSTDCLLGVKYLLSETAPNNIYQPVHTTAEGVTIYENPYALPLMFLADSVSFTEAETFADSGSFADSRSFVKLPEDNQPFLYQNAVFYALTGNEAPVFCACENVTAATANLAAESEEFDFTQIMSASEKSDFIQDAEASGDQAKHSVIFSIQNPEESAYIEFQVTAQNTEPMYAFFQSEVPYANLYVDGEEVTSLNSNDFDLYFNGLLPLGEHQPGDTVVIRIEPETENFPLEIPEFYYQDTTALAEDYRILTTDSPEIKKISNSRFEVNVEIPTEQYMIFSVPYDQGWKVKVDGQKTDCVAAFDTLMAVPLTAGQHTITFSYFPQGLGIGLMLTILTALSIIFILVKSRVLKTSN